MVQVGKKRAIKFWKYYKEWYETYKYGDVRDVTYQRYILTLTIWSHVFAFFI